MSIEAQNVRDDLDRYLDTMKEGRKKMPEEVRLYEKHYNALMREKGVYGDVMRNTGMYRGVKILLLES